METENKPKRLYSLDALRGFDMFWIMGGEAIFAGLAPLPAGPYLNGGQFSLNMFHGTVFIFTI